MTKINLAALALVLLLIVALTPATQAQAKSGATLRQQSANSVLFVAETTTLAAVHVPTRVVNTVATRSIPSKSVSRATQARALAVYQARVRARVVQIARSKVGDRYVAGRAGPNKFDCSGLSLYVWRIAAHRNLPHYSRAQEARTKRVSARSLQPGDLVFFFRHGAHHVGIYIGRGKMVAAANHRQGVRIDSVFSGWYGKHYSGAGRLF